jgi:sugar lactone lactonase YvrE
MPRRILAVAVCLIAAACGRSERQELQSLPLWSFEPAQIFPADRSLLRPEDGVVLADGRVVVADQAYGLRIIAADGAAAPFGRFADAGYRLEPPAHPAGPNGVSFEPDRQHVLVADIYSGAIYRVATAGGETTLAYKHRFGVNSAERDSTGAIWFTQSTENPDGPQSETRMFAAIDRPIGDGALYRIAPPGEGEMASEAELILGDLDYANGLAIDEKRGEIYIAETMADQVSALQVDFAKGAVKGRRVVAEILTPDNLKLDEAGRLWVASPLRNEIVVVWPETGEARSVFRAQSAGNDRIAAEWRRRRKADAPTLNLFTPEVWAPLPGAITSVILAEDGPVYVGGLGDALLKLDR